MTVKQKYLIYLSYIGTTFRGSQIQNKGEVLNAFPTVQGTVEQALGSLVRLEGLRPIRTLFCSRTDAGVHAIKIGLHVNLPPVSGKIFLSPVKIQSHLNGFFTKKNIPINVLEILKVPNMFNARYSAIEKVYLYRLGILKKEFHTKELKGRGPKPVTEVGRTFFFRSYEFDKKRVQEVAEMFVGEKDFGAFIGINKIRPDKSTVCNIKSFNFEEAQPLMPSIDPLSQLYDYYHLTCKGERFLYHMVRKMVGVLVSVASNRIPIEKVKLLFDEPQYQSWSSNTLVVPGHALYLLNVAFNPNHLVISEEEENQKRQLLEEQINLRKN